MLDQNQNEYLIEDLANKSGVKERTIRYYQQEELLPKPEYRGKLAYYNEDHLVRLELILELKTNYWPLRDIKDRLKVMNYEQALDLLDKFRARKLKSGLLGQISKEKAAQPTDVSAQEYISRVLHTQVEIRDNDFSKFQPAAYNKAIHYVAGTPSESWQRILLTPGIEIQVREPLSPSDRKRLEELIRLAKSIFT